MLGELLVDLGHPLDSPAVLAVPVVGGGVGCGGLVGGRLRSGQRGRGVADGLVGRGEGVINGAGTAELVASVVLGEQPPFDASLFDPFRFA